MKFNLPAYTTNFFSTKIWVKCPKCAEKALVVSESSKTIIPIDNNAKIHCINCSYKEENTIKWNGFYQGFLQHACGFCGSKFQHATKPTKVPFIEAKIQCTACKNEKKYELCWAPYRSNTATDPYFGNDLWLQTNVKKNVLWGYNKAHLDYLKTYIIASLREDNNRHIYSLIANLPQWMIAAKNRDIVVKKIDKLIKLI
jgi:hypothetical protein